MWIFTGLWLLNMVALAIACRINGETRMGVFEAGVMALLCCIPFLTVCFLGWMVWKRLEDWKAEAEPGGRCLRKRRFRYPGIGRCSWCGKIHSRNPVVLVGQLQSMYRAKKCRKTLARNRERRSKPAYG